MRTRTIKNVRRQEVIYFSERPNLSMHARNIGPCSSGSNPRRHDKIRAATCGALTQGTCFRVSPPGLKTRARPALRVSPLLPCRILHLSVAPDNSSPEILAIDFLKHGIRIGAIL